MDVIAQKFDVSTASGVAALKEYVVAQVSDSNATNILATFSYKEFDKRFVVVLLSTTFTQAGSHAVGSYVDAASFSVKDGGTALAAYLNTQLAGTAAPAAPSLSTITAGALTEQGTPSVKITYNTPYGESAASAASSLAVADNHELVVASPAADADGLATGYFVYIGASGSEKKQGSTATAIGTDFTLTTAAGTGGTLAPSSNATSAKYLQSLEVFEEFADRRATVVVSN